MTHWLKKRLAVGLGALLFGGALVWNGGGLRAQDSFNPAANSLSGDEDGEERPRQKLTRDEAAKEFVNALSTPDISYSRFFAETSCISLKSQREFGSDAGYSAAELLRAIFAQWRRPNQTVRVQTQGDKTATVTVETDPTPPARPLVLIEEDGGWGVDLVETYAKWNGLEGVAKAEAIYKLTGVILEGLPRTEARTRAMCQSNLKQISLGILQYVQDYDEKFPLAKGWTDNLQPYLKSEAIFNCPALPRSQKYGYAYNAKLANKMEANFADTSKIVSVYETGILKRSAFGAGEDLAYRHGGGANFAFGNGRVKWFAKAQRPSFNIGKLMKISPPSAFPGAPPPP